MRYLKNLYKKFAKSHGNLIRRMSPSDLIDIYGIQSSSIYQSIMYQFTAPQFHADSLELIKILIVSCRAKGKQRGVEEKYNCRFSFLFSFISF